MNILITGGCGFLGSNLASDAAIRGDGVMIFDNLSRAGSIKNFKWLNQQKNIQFTHGDIRNQNDIKNAVEQLKPDAIFHLAGQVAMTTSIRNPRYDFEINTLGTHNLLEAVRMHSKKSIIIYSSTNKVYGNLDQFTYTESEKRYICNEKPNGFDENLQLSFQSPYGCSKGAAEQYILDYSKIYGLNTVVFRHSSMYGEHQYATYDQGWIGWFCQKALENQLSQGKLPALTISGTGKQVRDLLHVKDLKSLYRKAIENIQAANGHAFNIGGGYKNSFSILELFDLLEVITENKILYQKIQVRESDQKIFIADISKAKSILGWTPSVNGTDGVIMMCDWLKDTLQKSV